MDAAAADAAAEDEGDAGVAVVGSVGAVLPDRAAEFGGGHQHDVVFPRSEVAAEGFQGFRELAQVACQLARLGGVRVPTAGVGAADPQSDVGLDQARQLFERVADRAVRVLHR